MMQGPAHMHYSYPLVIGISINKTKTTISNRL